jgi:hypothetical protein
MLMLCLLIKLLKAVTLSRNSNKRKINKNSKLKNGQPLNNKKKLIQNKEKRKHQ